MASTPSKRGSAVRVDVDLASTEAKTAPTPRRPGRMRLKKRPVDDDDLRASATTTMGDHADDTASTGAASTSTSMSSSHADGAGLASTIAGHDGHLAVGAPAAWLIADAAASGAPSSASAGAPATATDAGASAGAGAGLPSGATPASTSPAAAASAPVTAEPAASHPPTSTSPAGPTGSWGLSTLGLMAGGVAVLAVAAGHGGSKDSSTATPITSTPEPTDPSTAVAVKVGPPVGPVLIEMYDAEGELVGGGLSDASGVGHLFLPADFAGPMLIKVTASSQAGIAYIDEATGQTLHYAGSLRAVIDFQGAASSSVTPLSELAVRALGITGDKADVDAATIVRVNGVVAGLFGLHDLTGSAVTVLDPGYDESDGLSDAERFGQMLAALSGADSVTGGIEATLASLTAALNVTNGTLDDTGRNLLSVGAAAFAAGPNAALAASINNGFSGAPSLALATGEDRYVNASETSIQLIMGSATLVEGDTIRLRRDVGDDGRPSAPVPIGLAHAVTPAEAAAGTVALSLLRADLPTQGTIGISAATTSADGSVTSSNAVSISVDTIGPSIAASFEVGGATHTMNASEASAVLLVSSVNFQAGDVLRMAVGSVDIGAAYVVQAQDVANHVARLTVRQADLDVDGSKSIVVTGSDPAGNTASSRAVLLTLDKTVPAPLLANPAYDSVLDQVHVRVSYSAAQGDILVLREAGAAPALASHTVSAVEAAAHQVDLSIARSSLGAASAHSLVLTATDAAGNAGTSNAVALTLPTPVPPDTTPPAAPEVAFVTGGTAGQRYFEGDVITVKATFDEAVVVGGLPSMHLTLGTAGGATDALYAGGSGTDTLTFNYTVRAGDLDLDGIDIAAGSLNPASSPSITIRDLAGNNAVLTHAGLAGGATQAIDVHPPPPDTTPPTVAAVSFVTSNTAGQPYVEGDLISVRATFDEAVVVRGLPSLHLTLDSAGGSSDAVYAGGSGTNALTFNYTVQAGDLDLDGIDIAAGSLNPTSNPSITISDLAGNDAVLTHAGLAGGATQVIDVAPPPPDTTAPTLSTVSFVSSGPSGQPYAVGDVVTVRAVFDEAVEVIGSPSVHLALDTSGSSASDALYTSGSGTDTLFFDYTVQAGDADADGIDIAAGSLNPTSDPSIAVRDLAGNDAVLAHGLVAGGLAQAIASPTLPPVLTFALLHDTGASSTDGITNDGTFVITMDPAFGASVDVSADFGASFTTLPGIQFVRGDGVYSPGQLQVRQTDGGNVSATASNSSQIVIDTAAPSVQGVTFDPDVGHLQAGESVDMLFIFDEAVTVQGLPAVHLLIDPVDTPTDAVYVSGSGTDTLRFSYVVQPGDLDTDGVEAPSGNIDLTVNPGAAITDLAGNNALLGFIGGADSNLVIG